MKYSTDGKEFITVRELMKLKSNMTIAERKMMRKIGKRKLWFDAFDFGYCLTVHKAQGSEWGNVLLFEESSGYWDDDYRRKWMYTAVTRSNDRLLIVA
jgi:superfamily I DNA/RNA helicase